MSDERRAELALDCQCELGEGLVWSQDYQALLWTDIEGARLWQWRPGEAPRSWRVPDRLGSFALCASGKVLLAMTKELALASLADAGDRDVLPVVHLAAVEPTLPGTRINDGKADRFGNFVFGTYNESGDETATGSFYQFSFRRGLRRLNLPHVTCANGLSFSRDGRTIYFCDSPTRQILCGHYEPIGGHVSGVREFARLGVDQGMPDGSTIDANGGLWNAEWGSGTVRRYTPEGRADMVIHLDAPQATCPAFGGPGGDRLFVTSAWTGLSAEARQASPHSGGLFEATTGHRGVPDTLVDDLVARRPV